MHKSTFPLLYLDFLCIMMIFIVTSCKEDPRYEIPNLEDYNNLVWSDEFDEPGLDTSKWELAGSHYWDHGEKQVYSGSPENVFISEGFLVIKARETVDKLTGEKTYTSACVRSFGKNGLEYGRMDIRAKMPFGKGIISGFTMKPMDNITDTSMANAIEMAVVRGNATNMVLGNIRFIGLDNIPRYSGDWYQMKEYNDFSRDYHTFSIVKEKGEIYYYVDGKFYYHVSKNEVIPADYPFDGMYNMNLNIAVGGIWAKSPDSLLTPFPQMLEVDYVRVYKKADQKKKIECKDIAFPDLQEYQNLVWSDEFTKEKINVAYWTHETGDYWFNNEIQSYTSDSTNAFIKHGCLVISAIEKPDHVQSNRKYTSARLITKGKVAFKYGRIDFKIKVDNGAGIWPAAWLLPDKDKFGVWPSSGEIDVMEIFGTDSLTQHVTAHFGSNRNNHRSRGNKIHVPGGFANEFHMYTLVKEEDHMWWYFDGKPCYHLSRKLCLPHHYPFNEDFHVVLNVAIGGSTAGYPDEHVVFPRNMWVDHVRIYSKE